MKTNQQAHRVPAPHTDPPAGRQAMHSTTCKVGIVVIGRNEGERLRRCLLSVLDRGAPTVYVDSGSSDGSAGLARSMGIDAVELDSSSPFTAGRGRNTGFEHLKAKHPGIEYVQFVDGDSELIDGWLEEGARALKSKPDVAVVCGSLREKHRDASIYNRLCDIEWHRTPGEIKTTGGIAMIRTEAFERVDGFDPTVIAGQDDELYLRIRRDGWKLHCLDADMAVHDAAMARFSQWWKRGFRAGHCFAEGAAMHGRSPERHWIRESRSIWFWGLIVPLSALGCALPTGGWSLLMLLGYPLLAMRIYRRMRHKLDAGDAALYTVSCVAAKFPQLFGTIRYHVNRLLSRRTPAVEHKT